MPKVICTDNYGRDYNGGRSETVHGEGLTQKAAEKAAADFNRKYGGEGSSDYYVVKPDDYQPFIFTGY